ncbi:MAG: NYN domain-containing protein, partial [bacterium]|nr:NYN domain-containing protein [bacterium]
KQLNWHFDYGRFKVWLRDKYNVKQAYLFLGMMPKYKDLYTHLQELGYTLVFKEVIFDGDGKAKGNCDADIVVLAMQDAYENRFDNAILVSSDGDYSPLVKFLIRKNKIETVVSPYETKKCSVLLKKTGVKIAYITDQMSILKTPNKKAPDVDEPHKGLFRENK